MYEIRRSTRFKRDVRRCQTQNKSMDKFRVIHALLVEGMPLPEQNRDHRLTGDWDGYRECHLEPDWLLIYKVDETNEVLEYVRMGSHAALFR